MKRNPYIYAVLALGYISILVSGLYFASEYAPKEDNVLMPIGMLALLTLSVAVMGFLFFYEPAILLLEGKRPEAIRYFFQTVLFFAAVTALVLLASVSIGTVI